MPIYFLFDTGVRRGIFAGLGIAWLAQLSAFAALVAATRREAQMVVAGWTVGTLLRLIAVAAVAWLTLAGVLALPVEPTLIALVIGLFALLLLESAVFRYRIEAR